MNILSVLVQTINKTDGAQRQLNYKFREGVTKCLFRSYCSFRISFPRQLKASATILYFNFSLKILNG